MKKIALALLLLLIPLPASADPEVVPGSQINLVARDARIPITVNNPDLQPIEVTLKAESTSFRLEVLEDVTVLLPHRAASWLSCRLGQSPTGLCS
jgi:P pilus assembly chaperone PapD